MAVSLDILEDGWVAVYTLIDPWTIDELMALYPKDMGHRTSVNHPVHCLVDLRLSNQTPRPGIFRARIGAPILLQSGKGQVCLVGATPLGRSIIETFFQVIRYKNAKYFVTLDEAQRYLRARIAQDKQAR